MLLKEYMNILMMAFVNIAEKLKLFLLIVLIKISSDNLGRSLLSEYV